MIRPLLLARLGLAVLLAACAAPVGGEAPTTTPHVFMPVPEEARADTAAREALAQYLGVPLAQIRLRTIAALDWPDTCLGLAVSGQVCQTVVTPGFRVVLDAAEASYEVRTDRSAQIVLIAGPVDTALSAVPADLHPNPMLFPTRTWAGRVPGALERATP